MKVKKRFAAIAVAAIMLFSIALSSAFVTIEANHQCSLDDCSICAVIQSALDVFKNTNYNGSGVELGCLAFMLFAIAVLFNDACIKHFTLVDLKIKLSN